MPPPRPLRLPRAKPQSQQRAQRGIVEQRDAQHEREQVEEPVVPGDRDAELSEHEQRARRDAPPAEAGWHEDEPGRAQLDRECSQRHALAHPRRELLRVPRRPRRQRLRPEVVVERREVTPPRVAARELRDPGEEHQLEEEQPHEPTQRPRRHPLLLEARQPLRGRVQQREQARLEQQPIPLKPQEGLTHDTERQVERPEEREHRRLRHPGDQQQGKCRAAPAEDPESPIPRTQPAQGREQPVSVAPVQRARPLEEPGGGEDPVLAHQARALQGKRAEGDQVNEPQEAQKQPARQDVSRVARGGFPIGRGRRRPPGVGDVHRSALKMGLVIDSGNPLGAAKPGRAERCRILPAGCSCPTAM